MGYLKMHDMKEQKILLKQKIMTILIIVGSFTAIIISVIWLYKQDQLYTQSKKEQLLEEVSVFFSEKEISALLYNDGYIWMGGRDGVNIIDPKTGEIIKEVAKDIQMTYTAGMCKTVDESVWIGHENGITVFDDEMRIDYMAPQIPKGRVNTIIEDKEGGVWAGIQGGAVHFVKESDNWIVQEILNIDSGLREEEVNAIGIDDLDGLWFGSYLGKNAGGISILRNKQWQYISIEEGLPHRYVTAIIPIYTQYMLVGVGHLDRGGMALYEKKDNSYILRSTYSTQNGLPGEKIRQLYFDSKDRLWITSESNGLIVCHSYKDLFNQQLEGIYLTTQNGLSDNEIKVIIEAEGYYWLGGRLGLTRIKATTIENLFLKEK